MSLFSAFRRFTLPSLAACALHVSVAAEAQPAQKNAEAEILKDVKAPPGFDATIFAAPPMANYPVFVAAATDGTLYVSSDGNGSLGRDPHRGRILRLRDLDGDGRADESKEFVKDVDSPRGLVWDHDRLYLLHPPHISEYIDRDGDGVAEESRILVKNIAFTFKDRPADHSSNGMEMGVDGWLYCAIGDFGFMEAEGTDGRKVQLRAGGVVRVRPDGTGLHIYSRGTRNILEAAVSPQLDVITRDNTNDGGGWDIRLHHNTGLAEHGYPSLYKNFNDEIIQPLADYGGGSGCGAAWIDEPGLPSEWNNAPFTADWGRGWVYQHRLTPKGATFTADQKQFIGVTRPTDLDVDGMSRIYVASWKGATFNWAGPDVGYIVQLRPQGFKPEPMPDFAALSEKDLVAQLASPSHRRRLEAQRTLIRKKLTNVAAAALADPKLALPGRIAALYAVSLSGGTASAPGLEEHRLRIAGEPDHQISTAETALVLEGLKSADPRVRLQAAIACGFQKLGRAGTPLSALLSDADPVVVHTAIEALKRAEAADACWPILDSAADGPARAGALRVLQGIHQPAVVDGLAARLQKEASAARRQGLFVALARLHFTDGEWKGDSWGTRPDTSGPYYQAAAWAETPRVLRALNDAVATAEGAELAALVGELNRHKVHSAPALAKIVDAASADASLMGAAIGQVARAEEVPGPAQALLVKAATAESLADAPRAQAVMALAKLKSDEAALAGLEGLALLEKSKDGATQGVRRQARDQFLKSGLLKERTALLEREGERGSLFADAALLMNGSPDGKAAFERAWAKPGRRVALLKAMALAERKGFEEQILASLDEPDEAVANAAREAAKALRLDRKKKDSPKVESMSVADAIAAAVKTRGDAAVGRTLFTQLTCANCHTVSETEPARGPYLGTIAATYKRPELAEAILVPNKTLAQGFVGNHFELKNGDEHEGFVVVEASDKVFIRNVAAQEIVIAVTDIARRRKLEKSIMPEGLANSLTIQEFASLLDYLEKPNAK